MRNRKFIGMAIGFVMVTFGAGLLAGCGSTGETAGLYAETNVATETSEVTEVPKITGSSEMTEVADTTESPGTAEASKTAESLEDTEVTGLSEAAEATGTTESLKTAESSEDTEVAGLSEAAEAAGTTEYPKTAESSKTTGSSATAGSSKMAGSPKTAGSSEAAGSSRSAGASEVSEQDAGEDPMEEFYITEIDDELFARMKGKSFKEDCTLSTEELRYLHILHVGFDGETHEGEMVVNARIAETVLDIFRELYQAGYQIEKVQLVDEYNADDELSMEDNNSSSFNFRFISHTTTVSKHGLGMAVDINTRYNPYIKDVDGKTCIEPINAGDYVDRTKDFAHKIDHDDLCYQLFTEHGFEWGGDWTTAKDYQHFEIPDSTLAAWGYER